MNIPPYWVKETREIQHRKVRAFGTSFDSMAQARELMEQSLRMWQDFLATPHHTEQEWARFRAVLTAQTSASAEIGEAVKYSASILEPIELTLDAQNIVTRNRYGALVLNSTSLCFVDVDTFEPSGFFSKLLSLKTPEQRLLQAVEKLIAKQSDMAARVYRTAHGWRVVLRAPGLSVSSEQMRALFLYLQADALYTRLCLQQQCWRARISPKPFGEDLPAFPTLPDADSARVAMQDWVQAYERLTARYGVCRLIACYGAEIHDPVLDWHDRATKALEPGMPLA